MTAARDPAVARERTATRERAAVLFRALGVQGSWNYETLTGTGFAFVILPALRRLYPDPSDLDSAIRRHEETFNCHPYLAPLALGAVIRLEEQGESPQLIARFKAALRGSLGTLGDQLIWTGWRPICLLGALLLLLLGAPWWLAVVAFLVLYNAGHLALMLWGFSIGLNDGRNVAERLRSSGLRRTQPRLMTVGMFLAGAVLGATLVNGLPGLDSVVLGAAVDGPVGAGPGWWPWLVAGLVVAVAGARWGERARRLGTVAVLTLALAGLVVGGLA